MAKSKDKDKSKTKAKAKAKAKTKAKTKAKPKAKAKAKAKAKGKGAAAAKRSKKATLADKADRHVLYQDSVQSPEADLIFFEKTYREIRGKKPLVLREDFCGTALISSTWVRGGKKRRAVGVDLHEPTLQWGREHNLTKLNATQLQRLNLICGNVLDGGGEKADMTCAMNFSYGVFKARPELRSYFQAVYDQLADDGVFFTELYGGTEAVIEVKDRRDQDGFTYVWHQEKFNPISHETLCHIHFEFPDKSKIRKAFTYDWRLWTIPEVRELLHEVGFKSVRIFWEAVEEQSDGSGEFSGTGEYYPTEEEENQESWLVYLVAAK